jgi:predicted peroxiredoxin
VSAAAPVVAIISTDPRASHRAAEALRIGLGLVASDRAATVVLAGPGAHLLDADTEGLVDGDDVARFRTELKRLGVPLHVDRAAVPVAADWNAEGHPVVLVSPSELAALVDAGGRFLVF